MILRTYSKRIYQRVEKMRNVKKSLLIGVAMLTGASFGAYAPDLPMAGWATQGGGTTGGAGYDTVTVSTLSDLQKYALAGNKVILVKAGTYTTATKNGIQVGDNVTIYGYQGAIIAQTKVTSATDNTAINVTGHNVIIRNITIKGAGSYDYDAGDCMHIYGEDGNGDGGSNIWIDHVTIYDGEDGNLDVIHAANYVTISWVKFSYTSASTNHQFSNLIGNSATRTSDNGYLKVSLHHNWWGDGVKERMPRVRFGKVHVANNLFTSSSNSYNVGPGVGANVLVEGNVFINQKDPLKVYSEGDMTTYPIVYSVKNNYGTSNESSGSAFTPSYTMGITDVSTQAKATLLQDSIEAYAGATLPDPRTTTTSSSSVAVSSSSVMSSSSSAVSSSSVNSSSSAVISSSSSVVSGAATLEKHGAGPSTQTVAQGSAIDDFYFTWTNATGAVVTGLPDGVTTYIDGTDIYITGTVSSTAALGDYDFIVTTTGATTNATKAGTITVTTVSSSSVAESSSSGGQDAIVDVSFTKTSFGVTPNTISTSAVVHFTAMKSGAARLVVMNVLGNVVRSESFDAKAGENSVNFFRNNLPSGTYYMSVRVDGVNNSQKVMIK